MVWRVHFGFKLSAEGRKRVVALAEANGYAVSGSGWDFIDVNKQVIITDRDAFLSTLLKTLFWQEKLV